MAKSREHIKNYLSTVRPATEKDYFMIRLFLNKHKVKTSVFSQNPEDKSLESITFEQLEIWYNTDTPMVGDIIKCSETGCVGIVTRESWDSFTVGAALSSEGVLSFEGLTLHAGEWLKPEPQELKELQKALSREGSSWNPIAKKLITREIPRTPKYVRLFELREQVGIGIFKAINEDNTLEMFCVKMGNEKLRLSNDLNLGDADCFTFFDAFDEHRAIIQEELGEKGYVWNPKCYRIQKNNARARIGGIYFWIDGYFKIKQSQDQDAVSDRLRFNRGNYFLNRKTADRARDRIINICKEVMISDENC